MITISNSQRDYIVKYIDILCEVMKDKTYSDIRVYNTIRMARKLKCQLEAKQPLTADDLSHLEQFITTKK